MKDARKVESMLNLSNQKILFNPEYYDFHSFRDNEIPVPVFFAIPTLAFHVSLNWIKENRNFIQETVLYLKRNGQHKDEIAEQLCLDPRLVDVIIENSKNYLHEGESENDVIIEKEEKSKDFYIFYDLLTNQFIEGVLPAFDFNEFCTPMTDDEFSQSKRCYYLRENIGDSYSTHIHFLPCSDSIFNRNIVPSQENIISCYKEDKLFDESGYQNARYLNEVYNVWLTVGYSVTKYNTNEYSVINPFSKTDKLSYSTYLYNVVKKAAIDSFSREAIDEYHKNTENSLIKHQNERMYIRTNREKSAYETLKQKYEPYNYFKGNSISSKFETQLVKMQSTYDYIKNNLGKKDCSDSFRSLFDFANNVLEQLFTITYEPYILTLPEQLKQDRFFDALGNEKTIAGEKMIIQHYCDSIESPYDLNKIINGISVRNIAICIKKKNILSDKSYKLNLKDLFTLNILCVYYNRNSGFYNLFKKKIPYLTDTITFIVGCRQFVRHSFEDIDKSVNDLIATIYQIIDCVLNVTDDTKAIDVSDNADPKEDYSEFIGKYHDLDNISPSLQDACNRLLRDIYNTSELYFSDCVAAFQETSRVILDYVMRKVNSISALKEVMKSIPDDETEAKLLLMEKLESVQIEIALDNIKFDVKRAKNCIMNCIDINKASTELLIAPLLLSLVDNISFITLFENLGSSYFQDAISSINLRGHDAQSTDWSNIKCINDKYLYYCKILTQFEKEDL